MMKKNESTGRGRTNGIYQVTKDECERCVRDALEVGYRSIDTAQSYFNEEEVGKAIEKSGIDRKEIFLTSKVWIEHFGYEECKKSVLESVEKLRTDYLDLMLLHQPFGDTYGAWRALEELYKEGKLHAIGISNHYTDRMVEFANFTNIKPMVNQILLHISNTPLELVEYCQKNGITVEAYSPIAHGEILNQPEIKAIADKYGVTVPQLCIRYTIQLGAVSLPKTANPQHMVSNAQVDFAISEEDMQTLKNFKKIENYGESSAFPVYGGKL